MRYFVFNLCLIGTLNFLWRGPVIPNNYRFLAFAMPSNLSFYLVGGGIIQD